MQSNPQADNITRFLALLLAVALTAISPVAAHGLAVSSVAEIAQAISDAGSRGNATIDIAGGTTITFGENDQALAIGDRRNITFTGGGSDSLLSRGELGGAMITVASNSSLNVIKMAIDATGNGPSGDIAVANGGILNLESGAHIAGRIVHEGQSLRMHGEVTAEHVYLADERTVTLLAPLSGDAHVGIAVEDPRDGLVVVTGDVAGSPDRFTYLGEGYTLALDGDRIILVKTTGPVEPDRPLDTLRVALAAGGDIVVENSGGPIAVDDTALAVDRGVSLTARDRGGVALTRGADYGGALIHVAEGAQLAFDHITLVGGGNLVDLAGALLPGEGTAVGLSPADGGIHLSGGTIDLQNLPDSAAARIQVALVKDAADGTPLATGATEANYRAVVYLPEDNLTPCLEGDALVLRAAGTGEPGPGEPDVVGTFAELKAALAAGGDITIDNRNGPIPVSETLPVDGAVTLTSVSPTSDALSRAAGFEAAYLAAAAGADLHLTHISLAGEGLVIDMAGELTLTGSVTIGGSGGGLVLRSSGRIAVGEAAIEGASRVAILSAEGRGADDAVVTNLLQWQAAIFTYLPGDYALVYHSESSSLRLAETGEGPIATLSGLNTAFKRGGSVVIAGGSQPIPVTGEPVILPGGQAVTLSAQNPLAAAVTRGTGYGGELFLVEGNASLTLWDITLTGGDTLLYIEQTGALALRGRVATEAGGIRMGKDAVITLSGPLSAGSHVAIAGVDDPAAGRVVAVGLNPGDAGRFAYTGGDGYALRAKGDTLVLEAQHTAFDLDELVSLIADAPTGEARTITLGEGLVITGDTTLDSGGKAIEITRRTGLTGPLFTVDAGGSLTLSGLAIGDAGSCVAVAQDGALILQNAALGGSVTSYGHLTLAGRVIVESLHLPVFGPGHLDVAGLSGGKVILASLDGARGGEKLAEAVTEEGIAALTCRVSSEHSRPYLLYRSPVTGALLLADGTLKQNAPFDPAEPADLLFTLSPAPDHAVPAVTIGGHALSPDSAEIHSATGLMVLSWDAVGELAPGLYDMAATFPAASGGAVYLGALDVAEPDDEDDDGNGSGNGGNPGGNGSGNGSGGGSGGGGGGRGWTNTKAAVTITAVVPTITAPAPVALTEAAVLSAFDKAHAEAAPGLALTLTLRGIGDVPAEVLSALSARAADAGRPVTLQFDSLSAGGAVDVRLYRPLPLTAGFDASGGVSGDTVTRVEALFARYYSNRTTALNLGHTGDFESPARLAARLDLGGYDTDGLVIYRYDTVTNRYHRLADADTSYRGGYLYFTAPGGGCYVVSEGVLTAK